jgi:uncharacterized protein YpuA (DUF1002 family)
VRITQKQQQEERRARVLELHSQGLSQRDIVKAFNDVGLEISQKTVSNDLVELKKEAVEFVKKNRENLAFEYQQVMSNLYQLRKEAWKHFNSTRTEAIKADLYGILESINSEIMNLLAVGDMIEKELLERAKQHAATTRREMNNTVIESSSDAQF